MIATNVSQALCSAISCGYSQVGLDHWAPLATLVLDAAYEATLLAALLPTEEPGVTPVGPRKVWLTFLGGGAFGNRTEWIGSAIGRALARMEGLARAPRYSSLACILAASEQEFDQRPEPRGCLTFASGLVHRSVTHVPGCTR